ncbi:MAG TPA: SAM-dependent methyltransferase [Steroidobacteraceae bacterium]|jgi:SAM-dependent MidA family methyltransferase|nr:SAM-dependent methyltransferase [Steroidobacteraceae bacterium]
MTGGGPLSNLPPLSSEQMRHESAVLAAVEAALAEQGGWLSLEEYLRIVLYAPGLGYYSAGSIKLGRDGDYVTAPELGALFGRALARQCAELLALTDGDILELGAGTGALAATLLPTLQALGRLPRRYGILEVSADLQSRQRERLATLPGQLRERVHWLTQPPAALRGICLANEVADALPFRRFVVGEQGYLESGVTQRPDGALVEADRPAGLELSAEIQRIAHTLAAPPWPPGYTSEVCLLLPAWLRSISAPLLCGALMLIDYGLARHEYYHLQRARGTLRCHFRHRAHEDVLLHPGLQDITAWVDFTRVAEAGVEAGLEVAGYCTQAAFLLANGIEQDVASAEDQVQRTRLAAEARRLLLPGEMGEAFKVMALTRGLPATALRGFGYQDLRRTL